MNAALMLEQGFNGIQFGLILFLMAVGVTLAFGVMNVVNLAHGSMLMLGAFAIAAATSWMPSFLLALIVAMTIVATVAAILESLVVRPLYRMSHLDQVLATFGLSLAFNEAVIMVWGREPLYVSPPDWLAGSVPLAPGLDYPAWRLAVTAVALATGVALWFVLTRTRLGMQIRAGAEKREVISGLGVNIEWLFTAVFVISAVLAAIAGVMLAPLLSVESAMGDPLLILTLAVVVIGGLGSLKGALIASLVVGLLDTYGRMFWPQLLGEVAGNILANAAVYVLMAAVIAWRPTGLFGRHVH
ncbi:branched-chain amino acid ABC transporter permease [Verminephrobacter eiseniae]|uniref:branched-chain amino acid ABC transporter permease n=1 Tax=Verminephrobacter eiseniae TaxID=364317 RepID=UPI0022374163|nr:branched-chain amino acid ABC transporter permease [Verminephrobacter eiseniae]MCW5230938.1 branched-chain amino acid ABC transporter permease [Verminephrobacter eiseniae]MCW5292671.1 branched-chain amino acid ABC transporter permease [Verminephrobacter eiseniae]MCW8187932.1 branched-chain amino acid ABC transporter permease [Verminephrobacter eiseniae]MCW8226190.1 branched-chain amino acid ABC transporter permease [Verminephrobacter eiseniae]MCW8236722.1 branched-chain amino acid ABC trans